eukprot:57845-Amphidinium_carterae.1
MQDARVSQNLSGGLPTAENLQLKSYGNFVPCMVRKQWFDIHACSHWFKSSCCLIFLCRAPELGCGRCPSQDGHLLH